MEFHEYISNVEVMKMRKKDKEVKENKEYKQVNKKKNHAKISKPIMKEN